VNLVIASALLILGFLAIVAEVFFPSLGALSVIAVLALGGGVTFAFRESVEYGFYFLGAAVLGGLGTALGAFKLFPKTPLGKRLIVAGPTFADDSAATDQRVRDLLGKTGRAVSTLRPAGIAEIEGRRIDCVADGEHLDAGTDVTVVRLEGNRVVVRAIRSLNPSKGA
jgi:membrane-bound serine protease (ClpP class)